MSDQQIRELTNIVVNIGMFVLIVMVITLCIFFSTILIKNKLAHINGDLNHDNELTIKDLSILAAQINNK